MSVLMSASFLPFKYQYVAEVLEVHDGDTVTLRVDLGFGIWVKLRFRLYGPDPLGKHGLNAPELNTPEGKVSRSYLVNLLSSCGNKVYAHTVRDRQEKYGRYLCVIYLPDRDGHIGLNVNQMMIDNGYAKVQDYSSENYLG